MHGHLDCRSSADEDPAQRRRLDSGNDRQTAGLTHIPAAGQTERPAAQAAPKSHATLTARCRCATCPGRRSRRPEQPMDRPPTPEHPKSAAAHPPSERPNRSTHSPRSRQSPPPPEVQAQRREVPRSETARASRARRSSPHEIRVPAAAQLAAGIRARRAPYDRKTALDRRSGRTRAAMEQMTVNQIIDALAFAEAWTSFL